MSEKLNFEEAMKQLDEIVKQLEDDNLPLDKAISYYEKGMELSKLCNELLEDAEKKIALLVTEEGNEEAFNEEN